MHRYRVMAVYKGQEYVIHDVFSQEQIYDDTWTEEVGKTPSFNFSIPRNHTNIQQLHPLETKLYIYDNGAEVYDGRVISDQRDILNTGKVSTVGALSYLTDSQQPPTQYTGSITGLMDIMLANHNAQSTYQFTRGNVTVTDSNDYINRSWSDYDTTWSLLNSRLVDTHGGYLSARHLSGNNYALDYVTSFGDNQQVVRLGENILDITSNVDASEIITRLIPLGAQVDENLDTGEKYWVTINSVNGGVNYLERTDLVEKYGIITGVQRWENVTLPVNLLSRAQDYINAIDLIKTFEIKVIDLSLVDDIDELGIGKVTTVISGAHEINAQYRLSKKTKHLTAPANDTITLGDIPLTLTQAQANDQKTVENQILSSEASTNIKIDSTAKTITGAKGGYVILDTYNDDGELVEPWQILIMDTPNKRQATNVIRMNQNGIGFSTSGYEGPYENAWTIDGKLDATFIRTGNLIIGGATWNTDGAIKVLDSSDNVIGTWDKDGLSVLKGVIQGVSATFGGTNNTDGSIKVLDASGNVIGTWDKDGLSVLKGVIQGINVISSIIRGGTIDIGDGTFEVNEDGEVNISSGTINIGNVYITENYAWLGDYGISATGAGVFYSRDGEIEISTSSYDGSGPSLMLKKGNTETRVSFGGIRTGDVSLSVLERRWGVQWSSVADNIIALWERVESLEG